jgi:lysophospholipase L1-like esterase
LIAIHFSHFIKNPTMAMLKNIKFLWAAVLWLSPLILSADELAKPADTAQTQRFPGSLTVHAATDTEALVVDVVFNIEELPKLPLVDIRMSMPVEVAGDGDSTTFKLFALDADGNTLRYLTETTLNGKVALFVLPDAYFDAVSPATIKWRVHQVPNSGLQAVIPPNTRGTLMLTTDERFPMWTLSEILAPVWKSGRILNETSLPVSVDGQPATTELLFHPADGLVVRDYTLATTYREGIDFVMDGKVLRLTANSSIPFLTHSQLFPDNPNAEPGTQKTHTGGFITFGEGTFFTDRQLAVSYRTSDQWCGPVPAGAAGKLPRTRQLLQSGEPIKIALFGDSISVGASASGRGNRPPYVPGYGELFIRGLRQAYQSPITFVNPSKGGGRTSWGLQIAPASLVPEKPDLCILGFGMNDGRATPVVTYIDNLKQIMEMVRAANPLTEFILVASMLPNPDWRPLAPMDGYLAALKELESETVAVADVWSMSEYLLKTKRYCDFNTNHVNHPSDFMVRIYAQVIMELLGSHN